MKCPICTSAKISLFHDKVWNHKDAQVYRCSSCDITFLYPQMSIEEEREFYANYNELIVKRGLLNIDDRNQLHEKARPIAAERYQILKEFFQGVDSVCEVGSATGAFLERLDHISNRFAVEAYSKNREFSKQFSDFQYADLSEVSPEEKFDIICMFHTFEHIRNPFLFLENCKSHLHEGGKVIIEVPHIQDPLISLYDCEAYKNFYFQRMHPFIYSFQALDYVFGRMHFHIEQVIYKQRYGLDNHLTWLSKEKPGGDPQLNAFFGKLKDYTTILEEQRLSDTIYLIATL